MKKVFRQLTHTYIQRVHGGIRFDTEPIPTLHYTVIDIILHPSTINGNKTTIHPLLIVTKPQPIHYL